MSNMNVCIMYYNLSYYICIYTYVHVKKGKRNERQLVTVTKIVHISEYNEKHETL